MYICGVDLASQQDYTAIVVVERQRRGTETVYEACHIERLDHGTRYPEVIAHLQTLMRTPVLARESTLVADVTGVGLPVYQELQQQGLRPHGVLIHGGDKVSQEGAIFRVPKRDSIGSVQVLLQSQRVKFGATLPFVDILVHELSNYRIKIDPLTAHDAYSAWREGLHDDLVLALALACWWGEWVGRRQAGVW
jgi:hypothetical protein